VPGQRRLTSPTHTVASVLELRLNAGQKVRRTFPVPQFTGWGLIRSEPIEFDRSLSPVGECDEVVRRIYVFS
jgi:hypothetical protein